MKIVLKDQREFTIDNFHYRYAQNADNNNCYTIQLKCTTNPSDVLHDVIDAFSVDNISSVTVVTEPTDETEGYELKYNFNKIVFILMDVRDASSSIEVRVC